MNGAYHFPYFVTKEFKEENRDLIDESLLGDSSFTPQLRALKKLFSKIVKVVVFCPKML